MLEKVGCICCREQFGPNRALYIFAEVHHILCGNRRMGHWYTLPLCSQHHRNVLGLTDPRWASIAQGRKTFAAVHGTEIDLWKKVQGLLGLPAELPASKIGKS